MRIPPVLAAAAALCAAARAQTVENNAGFGGSYRTIDLQAVTGNRAHFGCAELQGRLYVSGRAPLLDGQHVVHAIDRNGALVATWPQPAIHAGSAFGMRDLCTDGTHFAGGSEAGISIVTTSGQLATTWQGQPIAQPIAGAMLALLGVPRGLCWDAAAAGGAGRFYAVNFGSPIVEFDRLGNVTATFANQGWSGTGLALDPATGNLWLDCWPGRGDLVELARSGGTVQPTGRSMARVRPGTRGGGLSEADASVHAHAPWPSRFLLLSLAQGPDTLTVQRVALRPPPVTDGLALHTTINGGVADSTQKRFGPGDTITLRTSDAAGRAGGLPCWTLFNFPPLSLIDDRTDVTLLGLGTIVPELRVCDELSIDHPAPLDWVAAGHVGTSDAIAVGALAQLPAGFLVRAQTVAIDALSPVPLQVSNEVFLLGGPQPQNGIAVEAVGADSGVPSPERGFFRIAHAGGRPAVRSVRLDWTTSAIAGQTTMVFDIGQALGDRRHDGGNGNQPGCRGTWRDASDVATGLDYTFAANHRANCATGAQNAGFTIDVGDAAAARMLTYRFAGGLFTAGQRLEFDCDTDGGLGVSGDAMQGLVVHVEFVDGTVATGALAKDPELPLRAGVRL